MTYNIYLRAVLKQTEVMEVAQLITNENNAFKQLSESVVQKPGVQIMSQKKILKNPSTKFNKPATSTKTKLIFKQHLILNH